MKEMKQRKIERGFSLIEILIAVAILAIVALGIMALLPNGYKQITNAGRATTMDHLAQMKLDYLRSIPVSHLDLLAGIHPTVTFPEWPMPNGAADKYSLHWIVQDYTPLANAKSVIVIVGYDIYNADGTSKPSNEAIEQKRFTFPTLITQ
jgi:prepilin-type N-terminal cleavage/methylation domain-containing protein